MISQSINCMIFDEKLLKVVCSALFSCVLQLEDLLELHPKKEIEEDLERTRNALLFYNSNLEIIQFKSGDLNDR